MTSDEFTRATPPADGIWGTINGTPVTDDVIEAAIANAEAGFPGVSFKPVGRPRTVGRGRSTTVTLRLDPDRIKAVHDRAERELTNPSDVMRRALDAYLAS